ncbi:MAG: competence protein ComEC [Acidobacteriota bacterium]|jgi:competence protein ComEC
MRPHSNLFSHYPLVHLAVAFAAGICTAPPLTLSLIAGFAFTCLTLILFIKQRPRLAALTLLSALFFSGATLAELEGQVNQSRPLKALVEQSEGEPLTLTGWLDGPPEFARDRVYLSLRTENVTGRVSLLVTLRDSANEFRSLQLRYGTRIQVTTTLDRTGNYLNPGVSSLTEFLDRNGYDGTGLIKSHTAITRLGDTSVFPPLAWLYDWRSRLQQQIDTHFQPETAGVLDATLLGNRYNLSPAASERFREGGTFHVLVISGLHISFIGAVVFLIVKRLTRRRLLQLVFPALIVWAYSMAVGADASVVRAAFMFTFAGVATILFRQSSSLNALGGAALVLLVHSPKSVFDPSFQLTFLSVLAIVVIAWPLLSNMSAIGAWYPTRSTAYPPVCSRGVKYICEVLFWREKRWTQELARSTHKYRLFKATSAVWLERYHVQPVLRYTFGAVVVSASVQLMLMPLMIVYFHRISLASLVLNIVVSITLAVLVVIALVALLVGQAPLFNVADAINWLMVHSVDPFANSGWAGFRLPEYSGHAALIYAIYYLPLLVLIIALMHWRPLALEAERHCKLHRYVLPLTCAQLLLLIIILLHPFSSGRTHDLRIDFLDVGQGDSALVTMPDGTTLLIDAGGNTMDSTRRIGETVVSEYLWWRGLSQIDYVLATHADADHIDGLNDVLKNFVVRGALIARRPADDPEFAKFSQTLARTNTRSETIEAGDVIYFGDVAVSVLWPPAGGEKSTNNDSIVLRIQYGERSILLTGDIEQAAERSLLASKQQLHADVIKVAHHGSKTSSTEAFVAATNPQFAIISVGRTSRFGHPHQEVVERWQSSGATVLTTGYSGTITITTDGHALNLKTFQPQKATKTHK